MSENAIFWLVAAIAAINTINMVLAIYLVLGIGYWRSVR